MKRDLDLMRRILMHGEEHPHGFAPQALATPGYTEEQVGDRLQLLGQAGSMPVSDVSSLGDASPEAQAIALTNAGHDFLDATRDPTRWRRVRLVVAMLGGWTLDIVRDVAVRPIEERATRLVTTGSPEQVRPPLHGLRAASGAAQRLGRGQKRAEGASLGRGRGRGWRAIRGASQGNLIGQCRLR